MAASRAEARSLRRHAPGAPRAGAVRPLPAARPALQLSLQFADPQHRQHLPRHRVRRWLQAALQAPAQLTVRIVGSDEARQLNHNYRGKDYATNVLTFDYQRQPDVLADLVLCAPVVAAEAEALQLPLQAHYAHLLIHGALHAQGLDHETEPQALQMEALESAVMLGLGFADPYALPVGPQPEGPRLDSARARGSRP